MKGCVYDDWLETKSLNEFGGTCIIKSSLFILIGFPIRDRYFGGEKQQIDSNLSNMV